MSSNIATRLHRGVNMVIISECQDIFSSKIFYKCPEGTDGVATHEIRKRGKMKPVYKIEVHEERNEGQRSGCAAKSCRSILRPLSRVFLPFGFPDSVSRDYLSFQLWDTLQVRLFILFIITLYNKLGILSFNKSLTFTELHVLTLRIHSY